MMFSIEKLQEYLAEILFDFCQNWDLSFTDLNNLYTMSCKNKIYAIKQLRVMCSLPANIREVIPILDECGYSITRNSDAHDKIGLKDAKEIIELIQALWASGWTYHIYKEFHPDND